VSRRYTKEEVKYLKENYTSENKNVIIKKLKNRSWRSIQKKAFLLNLKRNIRTNKFSGKLSKLLDPTPESFYWLGFFIADAHISNKNNIQLNISLKDEEHLENLRNFLNYDIKKYYSNKTKSVRIILSDKETILKIKKLYKWKSNKTENPVKIKHLCETDLDFLLLGIIDGDGHINKESQITIKSHKSYNNFLSFLLSKYDIKSKINKEGLSIIHINKIEICKKLKKLAIYNNIPVLQRKWKNIDLNKLSKKEKTNLIEEKCFKYFDKNIFNCNLVVNNENISSSTYYKYLKSWKRKRC
jgi:hypothetical protein